jgi:hypothetical protein
LHQMPRFGEQNRRRFRDQIGKLRACCCTIQSSRSSLYTETEGSIGQGRPMQFVRHVCNGRVLLARVARILS